MYQGPSPQSYNPPQLSKEVGGNPGRNRSLVETRRPNSKITTTTRSCLLSSVTSREVMEGSCPCRSGRRTPSQGIPSPSLSTAFPPCASLGTLKDFAIPTANSLAITSPTVLRNTSLCASGALKTGLPKAACRKQVWRCLPSVVMLN